MMIFADRIRVLPPNAAAPLFGSMFEKKSTRIHPSEVYFARTTRAIKIGSAGRHHERIGGLSHDSCGKLAAFTGGDPIDRMIVLEGTDVAHERHLHSRFKPESILREWYVRGGFVEGFFDQLDELASRIGSPMHAGSRPIRRSPAQRAIARLMPGIVTTLEAAGLHRTLPYRYAAGTSAPSAATAALIERATGGAVAAVDWLRDPAATPVPAPATLPEGA